MGIILLKSLPSRFFDLFDVLNVHTNATIPTIAEMMVAMGATSAIISIGNSFPREAG